MLKSELRKEVLLKRKSLGDDEFDNANKRLLAGFKALDLSNIKSIHVFLPIVSKREPDTFAFIEYLEQEHPTIQIIVSKSDFENSLMSHFSYAGKTDLFLNHYQIPEPQNATPYSGGFDMVLVPLLAFDKKGYRVGYGKGFYDRFLSGIETTKVGISLFDAVDEIKDVHLNDIRLDFCITPDKIYQF